MTPWRRFPFGAEVSPDGRTHLRVWAPTRRRVAIVHGRTLDRVVPLEAEPGSAGTFSGFVDGLEAGQHYAIRLDDDEGRCPDPASRFQPEGPHGPSEVIDPSRFRWTDTGWRGVSPHGQVIYEMHVGTFTPEGTYAAAAERLGALAEVGVTLIEVMPLAEFAGRFGWGYDGVDLWAPSHLYGRPDDLRRFVDRAHAAGIGVILDVVYNHLGPDGGYLSRFSPHYLSERHKTEWGQPFNFDGPESGPVREFFVENAAYWVTEFHFDGLRLDAANCIFDDSPEHLVAALSRRVREAAHGRGTFLVAENERQDTRLVRPRDMGGYELDAVWSEDFHHSARVALTGHNEAYYSDYLGTAQEILSAVRWAFLYQGQRYAWQKNRRGTPTLDLPAESFVTFLENHDQVANTLRGARLVTCSSPGLFRAMTAVLLLGPSTPMLFQGQEWGSTRPFLFFADHHAELAEKVDSGRRQFLSQFPSTTSEVAQALIARPSDDGTFLSSKLDWSERDRRPEMVALHRDLIRLRRDHPAFASARRDRLFGAVLDEHALALRFLCPEGDRLLVVNLGHDLTLGSAPEPLLAPPLGQRWRTAWSSEDPRYGGDGMAPVETDDGFRFPGRAAVVLENGRPVWRFERAGIVIEKRVVVTYRQNTVRISYALVAAASPVKLAIEPAVSMRPHEGRVDGSPPELQVRSTDDGIEISGPDANISPLRLLARAETGATFTGAPREVDLIYRTERARGYDWQGKLRVPGTFELVIEPGKEAGFTASTEDWAGLRELDAAQATLLDDERRSHLLSQAVPLLRRGAGAELVLAADQFVITPRVRPADEARLNAEGDEARTIIAGYPWFTDWGRDTMISLEGLTLLTGRHAEARSILHTFAQYVRDGLIPNLFPEGETEGLYHTADATLWFFHAVDRYERTAGEADTRRFLMPKLVEIFEKHLGGTRFGIGVDPADGLLTQGQAGYQLTWMDAKVGDWVVTPRRGKAVEINALFYNALKLLESWLADEEADGRADRRSGVRAETVAMHAERLRESFNRRFWNAATGCLYDVVDGEPGTGGSRDDASIRPNQVLAISLTHPVLDPSRWEPVLKIVRAQLATPFGLRSLAPGHPDFKPRYDGDLRARDAAYHQGTIWGWLIGPFVDAWLKTFPRDRAGARRLLDGLHQELEAACIGTISEIYDAEAPFLPRGCTAQAWSVAETLRAIAATADG